jgi:putative oxygen-independent coproporphyrinogen III oxidase
MRCRRIESQQNGIINPVLLGLYISVPFCRTKCSYCNFASDVFSPAVFERYVDRICADITNAPRLAEQMGGRFERAIDSVYLGGGTPTVLDVAQLERVFVTIRQNFALAHDTEITVECAPGTLTPAILDVLVRCGVNRVSLGVQSFVDAEAAAVGRLHKRATLADDIKHLRATGIRNINIDLIAGLPHQTVESWQFSLTETMAAEVPHVSVYMLEVDEDSRLGRELIAGGTRYHAHFVPDEDATADSYIAACEQLESAGVSQYEISNFARKGFESRHNLKYWTRQPYLGFGVDAHSMLEAADDPYEVLKAEEIHNQAPGSDSALCGSAVTLGGSPPGQVLAANLESIRFSTPDSLENYIAAHPVKRTPVSRHAALEEMFFLGLRLTQGVTLRAVAARFGADAVARFRNSFSEFQQAGLIQNRGDRILLTPRGRLLSNEVFEKLISPERVQ